MKNAKKKNDNPNWREGRRCKEIPDFAKFLLKQKDSEMTVDQICSELCISRSTWYKRVRKGVVECSCS